MKTLQKIGEYFDRFGDIWSLVSLILAVLPTIEAVVLRFVMGGSTLWSREMTVILFGLFFIIGGAYAEGKNSNIQVDILYSRFRGWLKIAVDIFSFALCTCFCYIIFKNGCRNFVRVFTMGERSDSVWAPYLWPSRLGIVIGIAMLWLRSIASYTLKIANELKRNTQQKEEGLV